MAEKQNVVLINNRLGTRDSLSLTEFQNKNFSDLAHKLWKKYDDTLMTYGKGKIGDFEPAQERMPVKFSFVDELGSERIIEVSQEVEIVVAKFKAKQIFWDHVPLGGGLIPKQEFGQHAMDLISKPEYSNWKCLYIGRPGEGITTSGPDKSGIIRTLTIKPTGSYPTTPPRVSCEPTFKNDPCWKSGVLHFSYFKGNSGSAWEDLVKKSHKGINPLHMLVQELLYKFQFGV